MEIINTKRGGKKLCLDGLMYTVKVESKTKDEIKWRCVRRVADSCCAILQTTKGFEQPQVIKEHNHLADHTSVAVEKLRQGMKEQACTTNDKPNQIFTFSTAAAPDEVKTRLPTADTVKRVLRRTRAAHRPKDPQRLQDLVIENQWTQTAGDAPTAFLHFDNGPDADERVVVFSTQDHLQRLASCDTWCMDGTFAVAPHLFGQLYVIHGSVNGVFLPLVYALLQRKTQTTYETLLNVLDQAGCDPSVIIIDFERSVENAITSIFGEHVNVQFCFYHLTQCIWRKIQLLGLTEMYVNDDDFRLFCGQIDALAFLPVDDVAEGMSYLRDNCPDEAADLLDYFDSTYVSGQLRPRRQQDELRLAFRRTPPMFQPARWNQHDVTLANQPRTNNICEGFNNKFMQLVGQDHPTIWKLIEVLQAECARVSTVMLQDDRGIRPKKRTKKVYTELQNRLHNLCQDIASGRKTIPQFLRGVSHNLRAGQPNV